MVTYIVIRKASYCSIYYLIHLNLADDIKCISSMWKEFKHMSKDAKDITYLDTAGRSVLPKSVEEIGIKALQCKSRPWLGLYGNNEDTLAVRRTFASLINADEESISLCPSTGFALTMAMRNIVRTKRLVAGQSVLVLDKDMASAVYPWQYACKEVGCHLKVVPSPTWDIPDANWTKSILEALDSTVAVLALPNVHWCNGALIELVAIAKHLATIPEERRPLLVIDGTQSVGALPLDVSVIKPAFMACSVHKWLLGSYGLSLAYVDPSLVSSWDPLDLHEQGRLGSDSPAWDEEIIFDASTHPQGFPEEFKPGARRLDAGGRPNYITIPMVRQGLTLLQECGVEYIQSSLSSLTAYLVEQLDCIKAYIQVIPVRCGHILGIRVRDSLCNLSEVVKKWKEERNVFVSLRGGWIRVAPYLFTTKKDMRTVAALLIQEVKFAIQARDSRETKRVLIVGSASWLAQEIFRHILPDFSLDIYGTYAHLKPHWIDSSRLVYLEVTNTNSIREAFMAIRPHVTLHIAALSSPFVCHLNPDQAYQINAPTNLLDIVQELCPSSRYVFTSTDMVYDGLHAPYKVDLTATLTLSPVNYYGVSKLRYEQALLTSNLDVCILRLSNMIGSPCVYSHVGVKFLEFLYQAYLEYVANPPSKPLGLKHFEIRCFIDIQDVAKVIGRVIDMEKIEQKVLNVGGRMARSRLELAGLVAKVLGVEFKVVKESENIDMSSVDRKKVWIVSAMEDPDNPPTVFQPPFAKFLGPKVTTMDIDETEAAMNMQFAELEDVVRRHLEEMQSLQHPDDRQGERQDFM